MFCPNCGSQITENVHFCPRCGTSITAQPETSDKTPPSTTIQSTPPETEQTSATTPPPTPATPESEQSTVATPAPAPTYTIVTLPSGKKIKVKNDKAQTATPTPTKNRAPLTDFWTWLLATFPPILWAILCWITGDWSVAFIGSGILTVVFALKDETALEKAGYRKEAPDFKLALALYPIFYLFIRAKRTNKNYGPTAIFALLCIIATLLFYTFLQVTVSDLANKIDQEQFENRKEIVSKEFNFFKLCANLKFVEAKIMSEEEFEAKWGFDIKKGIALIHNFDYDFKLTTEGTITEAEFKAKWGFPASARDELTNDFSHDFNRDIRRLKAGLMSVAELKAKWEINK